MDRIKESPRTVSALIIILIVAAAIYAFSGPKQPTGSPATGSDTPEPTSTLVATTTPATGTTAPSPSRRPASTPLPPASRTDSAYVEVAQRGNGVTHLARRATDRWLSENKAGYDVTKEHRIYIEDYIKDRLGRKPLQLGQTQAIPFDLIKDAVASAQKLSPQQLKHLSQYTHVLP